MIMKFAFATDDGENFTREHFGSAEYYLIYEYDGEELKFMERIANTTGEEEKHGDEEKARRVMNLMRDKAIKVFVASVMGPNITIIRKRFVPVISRINNIEEAIKRMNFDEIAEEARREGEKRIIYIR